LLVSPSKVAKIIRLTKVLSTLFSGLKFAP